MLIERQLENDFIAELKSIPELSASQVVGSREVASAGETKSEEDTKATIVAVACGFRQNDAFSLSPISMPMSIAVMTRAELDPTSELHDHVVERIADLLSRWHKYGDEMTDALTSEKFLAGELRMDGGTNRVYDSTNSTWSETLTFTIRGSEKFTALPVPYFPDSQGILLSDGTRLPVADRFFYGMNDIDIMAFFSTLGQPLSSVVEIDAFSKIGGNGRLYSAGLSAAYIDSTCQSIDQWSNLFSGENLQKVVFRGRTLEEVQAMSGYPWGLQDTSKIQVQE